MSRLAMSLVAALCLCFAVSPTHASCPGDCDGSGAIEFDDLVAMLFAFGATDPGDCDADASGSVDFNDLTSALFRFGPCDESTTITMDGSFDDWAGIPVDATDPLGDASGAFDITEVSVTSRDTTLYVRFDTNSVLNLQSGNGSDGTLLIRVTGPEGDVYQIDTRNRQYTLNGQTGSPFGGESYGHNASKHFAMPTYASEQYEITLDTSIVGASMGDTVTVQFGGSDALDAPIAHTLGAPPAAPFEQAVERGPGTDLRIANLNVLSRGLTDPDRSDDIHALLRAVDADVYCFQEQWDGSTATVRNAMAHAFSGYTDGREDASNWNVSIENGAAVATTLPFQAMDVPGSREGGGIVTLDDGSRVFVLSIHLKCCGHIGSSEDIQRINATMTYESFFESLRDNEPGLGIVIAGDWNLVGSRTPLDVLTTSSQLGLTDLRPLQATERHAVTWRSPTSSFTPGRLDLIAFSPETFTSVRGFILDSSELDATTLGTLGLDPGDSEASDHLMLVADFDVID